MAELLLRIRALRRFWQFVERWPPFLAVFFSREGMGSAEGRQLIWGKFRRIWLSAFPPLARALQRHYKLEGGCQTCGASCKMLIQCIHFDDRTDRCTVYEDRPNICRYFPITPADIRDRDLVSKNHPCGFTFAKAKKPVPATAPIPAKSDPERY